jgi:hypothetical protein
MLRDSRVRLRCLVIQAPSVDDQVKGLTPEVPGLGVEAKNLMREALSLERPCATPDS